MLLRIPDWNVFSTIEPALLALTPLALTAVFSLKLTPDI